MILASSNSLEFATATTLSSMEGWEGLGPTDTILSTSTSYDQVVGRNQ